MKRVLRLAVLAVAAAAVVWTYCNVDISRHASVAGMQALVDSAGAYGPLAFMAVCVGGIFLHLPLIVLVAIGGIVFGPPRAFVYVWCAAMVGTTATFVLVRYLARDLVQRSLDRRFLRLRELEERLARNGFWTVLVLRVVFFLSPPINWTLGATRVRLSQYVAGTALGIVPQAALTVVFADHIANRPAGDGIVSAPMIAVALLVLGLLASGIVVSRRILRGDERPPA